MIALRIIAFCFPFAMTEFDIPSTASHRNNFAKLVRANAHCDCDQCPNETRRIPCSMPTYWDLPARHSSGSALQRGSCNSVSVMGWRCEFSELLDRSEPLRRSTGPNCGARFSTRPGSHYLIVEESVIFGEAWSPRICALRLDPVRWPLAIGARN